MPTINIRREGNSFTYDVNGVIPLFDLAETQVVPIGDGSFKVRKRYDNPLEELSGWQEGKEVYFSEKEAKIVAHGLIESAAQRAAQDARTMPFKITPVKILDHTV